MEDALAQLNPCLECKRYNHSECVRGVMGALCNCGCEVVLLRPNRRPKAKSTVQKNRVS